jgi:twitching motility protein PilU
MSQREIGHDSVNFAQALRAALREDPDIMLVGELRDVETMEVGLHAAETGHLVMSTLHTLNAAETINRMISMFPPHQEEQIRGQLAAVIQGIVSQRLVVRADGRGRVPAVEVMLNSPLISDLIFKGDVSGIKEIMKKSRELGMQTFDQSLFDLYEAGLISYEDALRNADSVNDLRLAIKLHSKEAKNRDITKGIEHLDIVK